MKKILVIVMALIAVFSFSACSDNAKPDEGDENNQQHQPGGDNTDVTPDKPDEGDTGDKPDEDDKTDEGGEEPGGGATLSYSVSEMSVDKNGANIYGKLYKPDLEGVLPAVILSHSSSMTADSMNSYCIGFAERGYVAYAFDFCGGSKNSRSDGNTDDMTIFTEVDDLKAVIAAVKALDFVDEQSIYLFGTSQGGLVSALTANDMPEEIAGLILLYPAYNIAELAQKFGSFGSGSFDLGSFDLGSFDLGSFDLGSFDLGSFDLGSLGGGFTMMGDAFIESLQDYDVYEHIAAYKGRVIIIHGSSDFIVNPSYSERAAELYENCELHVIQGANHGFNSENMSMNGDYDGEVWEYIDAYFAKA